jgi:hypothetical protein
MRELTKSVLSFSWAASLLGAKELANLLSPQRQQGSSSRDVFDTATRGAIDQMGGSLRQLFAVGDQVQRGVVNTMFGVFTLGMSSVSGCGGMRNSQPGGQAKPAGNGGTSSTDPSSTGWGPMPSNQQ